ncbi:hypothetical protein CRUP_011757 [Coryphaenoides rupestris]|nr:hypothetical protein CRUP_011757 [Coryphaenoides rupestris]
MENSRAESDQSGVTVSGQSGQVSQPSRPSKHWEWPSKSPRRRREAKKLQRRGGDHQQPLLQETVCRRIPGQCEHSAHTSTATETAEDGSPKRHIQDPASQRLTWTKPPSNVLVIRKIRDESLVEPFKELCRFLVEEKQMMVYVERRVVEDCTLSDDQVFGSICNQLCTFREGNAAITLRSRLKVKVVKVAKAAALQRPGQQEQPRGGEEAHGAEEEEQMEEHNGFLTPHGPPGGETGKVLQLQVLNEVVVDRGPSSYLSNVDLYLDGRVIVSTPTGSTAYAAAAGASMIHPNVPAIMVTPICPHSLSFRPIVVPAGVELMITTSCFPVPSICCHDLVYDWFESLAQCLHWNVRKRQARLANPSDSSDTEN